MGAFETSCGDGSTDDDDPYLEECDGGGSDYGDGCSSECGDEITCDGIVSEDPIVCNGNGFCTAPDTCVCWGDWSGQFCDQQTDSN